MKSIECQLNKCVFANFVLQFKINTCIGKQRALNLDIWSIPNIGTGIGYSCV